MELNIKTRGDRFALLGTYFGMVFESEQDWATENEAREERWVIDKQATEAQERMDLWAGFRPGGMKG